MTAEQSPHDIRVRFAPSPTGSLHIGGARTAIYNWAYARRHNGTFILRIEDTDPERSTEENTQVILRAMKWLGLDWDEGPEVGGEAGPYFQTQRGDSYRQALESLIAADAVYPCFCSKETLDAKREAATAQGSYVGYDRTCRDIDHAEAEARIKAGEPYVWRLKTPTDRGVIEFDDEVHGRCAFDSSLMDDMVLVRSDGSPMYNFAVVCDDVNMGITHVVRGDDHISNTPRQILIYEALGYPVPRFAHLSMILGPDGKRLSKRHGATSVEAYRDNGFLPETMLNYLSLLGWSLDGETTIFDKQTLCENFSFERISKNPAVFDETKLEWMNGVYIQNMGAKRWVDAVAPFFVDAGLCNEQDIVDRHEWFERLYPLVAERLKRLDEASEKLSFIFDGPVVHLDDKSVAKVLLKEGSRADVVLREVRSILADETREWKCDPLQDEVRTLSEKLDLKVKFIFQPIRVAVTGSQVSPPLFESIELMKREDVLARIDYTLETVFGA